MKLTKNSYCELKNIHEDLSKFLCDIARKSLNLRMLVIEYSSVDKRSETLNYFDSNSEQTTKVILKNKKFRDYDDNEIFTFFELNEETSILDSIITSAEEDGKRQIFYIIFDLEYEMNTLLDSFLRRFGQQVLQRFNKRNVVSASAIIAAKQSVFDDTLKSFVNFDLINAVANSQYEGRESFGSIVYVTEKTEAKFKIAFNKHIDFNHSNLRLIRKLLEMSDSKLSLIIFEKKIIGLGSLEETTKKIQFSGRQKWTLFINQKEVLRFSRGEFFFEIGYNKIIDELPRGFIQKKHERKFNDLINMLMRQRHGALLIISDQAQEEVKRLSGLDRGYAIEPIDLTSSENLALIKNIASVDGAVFIDRQLKCYGMGVILDGIAKRSGSTARGGRYNSSLCYIDSKDDMPYVAIVFSEDETVDVLYNSIAGSFANVNQLAMPGF